MTTMEASRTKLGGGFSTFWRSLTRLQGLNRGTAWGIMIVGALLAFEIFNFSTTEFALRDVLGSLAFAGLPWATLLAVAFCSMDFAGIARIFTPQQGRDEPAEVWYLFGAWLLAAAFNATLTWWGVSVAIATQANSGSAAVLGGATLTRVVPVFVALMVWLIRVLIIGTLSIAGDKLFSTAGLGEVSQRVYRPASAVRSPIGANGALTPAPAARHVSTSFHPAPKPATYGAVAAREHAFQGLALDHERANAGQAGDGGNVVQ